VDYCSRELKVQPAPDSPALLHCIIEASSIQVRRLRSNPRPRKAF